MADSKSNKLKSIGIWKNRPNQSGSGSRGELARFKIDYINSFIKENNIKSMIDFGCGDLQVSSQFEIDDYLGVDIVAHTHPSLIKSKNYNTTISRFDDFLREEKAELCTCLDVLYHILHDELEYLNDTIRNILEHSTKYVIIYAQDSNNSSYNNWRGHMHNSPWRQIIEKENVKLISEQKEPMPGSSARFFIYEKL
jgi:predicted TPR repeat methyltransferase